MESILSYLESAVKTVAVGFVLILPFLANSYLRKAQELSRRKK